MNNKFQSKNTLKNCNIINEYENDINKGRELLYLFINEYVLYKDVYLSLSKEDIASEVFMQCDKVIQRYLHREEIDDDIKMKIGKSVIKTSFLYIIKLYKNSYNCNNETYTYIDDDIEYRDDLQKQDISIDVLSHIDDMFVLSHIKDNSQLKTGKILEMKRRGYKDIETLEILGLSRDQVTFHMKKARDIYKKIKDDNSIREIEERL